MTFAQTIGRWAGIAMLALLPLAAYGAPSAAQEGCGSAFADLTPARLEQLLGQPSTGPSHCYEDKLVEWGEEAVPLLTRLLHDERSFSRCLARTAIARREKAPGRGNADEPDADVFLARMGCHMADQGAPAASGARYLLTNYPDPRSRGAVSPKGFDLFWKFTQGYERERVDALHVMLAEENLSRHTVAVLAPFLAAMGRRGGPALAQLRAALRMPQLGAELVDPFLAVQGNDVGIAHLLTVYAASSDAAMHTAIYLALKKRASPEELDRQIFNTVTVPALLPAALNLIQRGIASPRTIDYFVERLDHPSTAVAAADVFIALNQAVPKAHRRLLAMAAGDRAHGVHRDALSKAIARTGALSDLARGALLDGARPAPGCTTAGCFEAACRSASMLASVGPLPPSDLPTLKLAYGDASRAGATDCLAIVAGMIADFHSRPALDFLYERFLDSGNAEHTYLLSQVLARKVELLVARIEGEIDGLYDARLAAVETLLFAPAAKEALHRHRERVLPTLLTLPFGSDADQPVPEPVSRYRLVIRNGPGIMIGNHPVTKGGLAVYRIGRLAPMTPEVVTTLLRVAAGPHDEAGYQAVTLLSRIRNQDRSLRAARFKEIEDLLAATAPGFAETRLEILRNHYRLSQSDSESGNRR
ncbi:hypothetical protein [Massilia sp. CCM 8734]|uniref:hypothetical protein n=1 Tax=Massilia sp. CCM 8734 TaxID=2609283 RepID=UPI0014229918|nr:hypothetical protein [Massilia sp. CCM 8734]NHZ95312.1 hypothetical protein [Massilia sp. CCM 8734]